MHTRREAPTDTAPANCPGRHPAALPSGVPAPAPAGAAPHGGAAPQPETERRTSRRTWLLVLAGATGFSVLYAAQSVLQQVVRDLRPDVPRLFALQLLPWLAWVLLLPAIYRAAERWPLVDGGARANWWRHLALAALAPFAAATVTMWPAGWLRGWWADDLTILQAYQLFAINGAVGAVAQYVLVAAACQAHLAVRRARREAVRSSLLAAQLSASELRALRAQLQPHFLFNSLNAIAAHVRDEPDVAEEMLERLSALLRLVLQGASQQEVPLRQELDMAGHYLGIHEIRFGSRLTVRFDVDPAVESALVPSMLLQPVVENAVVHGAAASRGRARVEVRADADGHRLWLVVWNESDVTGAPAARANGGIGLHNARARLQQLYGDDFLLDVQAGPAGARVEMCLPLRFAPARPSPTGAHA